jgi:hypothetical protein
MNRLKILLPEAQIVLTPEFLLLPTPVDVSKFTKEFPRDIDLETPTDLIQEAMHRFDETPVASDSWLAPRLHSALRLSRREAAEAGIWEYLAIAIVPQFVRWRWRGDKEKGTARKRYSGRLDEQAIARLWWGAELTRNGPDYKPTTEAFKNQDVPNTWFRLNLFHHKPAIQAAIRFVATKSSDETNRIARLVDLALKTTALDAIAPSDRSDKAAIEEWIEEQPPLITELKKDALPKGPDEPPVQDTHIKSVQAFYERIYQLAGTTPKKRNHSATGTTEVS